MDAPGTADANCSPRLDYTDHALLIAWGAFARQIGLLEALRAVPVPQKTVEHAPQAKLLQVLVATLAGCAHLAEMADGPRPLVRDPAVAAAWGVPGWADPSGVSRTCQVLSPAAVDAVAAVLQQVSQPFIDREVVLALRRDGLVRYDGDLTGREVALTSTAYPDARFGWMGDYVGLGYQAAVVSLVSPTYGRLLLASRRHPGNTASGDCIEELVRAAEAATGVRPRRRTELLAGRLADGTTAVTQQQAAVAASAERLTQAERALAAATAEQAARRAAWAALAERTAGPADRWAREVRHAHARRSAADQTVARRQAAVDRAQAWAAKQQGLLATRTAELAALTAHHAALVADNAANPAPIRARFRLDAGFGSGPNLAWLIEMGYDVSAKAHNAQVTRGLLATQPADAVWHRVGKNAEVWVQAERFVTNCPSPLSVAVERFHTGERVRQATLLYYGDDPVTADPTGWFAEYNARQTIEAGIKENKGVFAMHHLKFRSPGGLDLAEHCARFAANFVRWAAVWLTEQGPTAPAPVVVQGATIAVKALVRTAANTAAWIATQPSGGLVVSFTDRSPFPGLELAIGTSGGFQLPLPLLKTPASWHHETIPRMVVQSLR
jgi:hypothetical protein